MALPQARLTLTPGPAQPGRRHRTQRAQSEGDGDVRSERVHAAWRWVLQEERPRTAQCPEDRRRSANPGGRGWKTPRERTRRDRPPSNDRPVGVGLRRVPSMTKARRTRPAEQKQAICREISARQVPGQWAKRGLIAEQPVIPVHRPGFRLTVSSFNRQSRGSPTRHRRTAANRERGGARDASVKIAPARLIDAPFTRDADTGATTTRRSPDTRNQKRDPLRRAHARTISQVSGNDVRRRGRPTAWTIKKTTSWRTRRTNAVSSGRNGV